jgi:hypothetical protein
MPDKASSGPEKLLAKPEVLCHFAARLIARKRCERLPTGGMEMGLLRCLVPGLLLAASGAVIAAHGVSPQRRT